MSANFRAASRQACADGFAALRVAAEMGNFADAIGSVERLLDWERLCTPMLVRTRAGIAPDTVLPPPVQFTVTEAPWGLTVTGELDLASREVFGRVLGARLAARPWLRLDLSGLVYAEAGAPYQLRRVIDLAGFSDPRVIID